MDNSGGAKKSGGFSKNYSKRTEGGKPLSTKKSPVASKIGRDEGGGDLRISLRKRLFPGGGMPSDIRQKIERSVG